MLEFESQNTGLDIKVLIGALALLFFVSLILGVRIFLTNKIYLISRSINSLESQYNILNAENIRLKRQVEVVKYRYLSGEIPDFDKIYENPQEVLDSQEATKLEQTQDVSSQNSKNETKADDQNLQSNKNTKQTFIDPKPSKKSIKTTVAK